jgi:hypothetical protein
MVDSKKWCPAIHTTWLNDFNLVWAEVPEAKRLCDRLVEATTEEHKAEWDTFEAARQLRAAWEDKTVRGNMKIQGKPRTTKSSFATHPKFDGAPAEESKEVLNAPETIAIAMN